MKGIVNSVLTERFVLGELIVNMIFIVSIVIHTICSIHLTLLRVSILFSKKNQLSFGILEEFELLKRKFQGIKSIKVEHFDQEKTGEETLEEVNWHERVWRKVSGQHHPEG